MLVQLDLSVICGTGVFTGYSGLLPHLLSKGPFTCTFNILIHEIYGIVVLYSSSETR